MLNLGTVRPGTTIYIPFNTFNSADPSASVTISAFALADIKIFKDGNATERGSTSGFALLDTDGIDFSAETGVHGFSVDLADNTTANFYEAGSQYWVVVGPITVYAATVNFVAATFTIGYPDALLNTTIATLSSQTSFTLEDGSATNDAYNGCVAWIHDLASATEVAVGYVSDYVGSTKTVTLAADPAIFTMAAGDNFSLFPPANVVAVQGTAQTANDIGADANTLVTRVPNTLNTTASGNIGIDWANVENPGTTVDLSATSTNLVDTTTTNTDMRGTDNAALASVVGALADAAAAGDPTSADTLMQYVKQLINILVGTTGVTTMPAAAAPANNVSLAEIIRAIYDDSNELQGDWADAGRLDAILDARASQTTADAIETDTQDIQARLPAALVGGLMSSDVTAVSTSTTAADNLEQSALGIVVGAAVGTPTTTVIDTDLTEATDDHYIGRILTFVTGAVAGQSTDITDYNGTTKELTVTALTNAPAATDAFVIT